MKITIFPSKYHQNCGFSMAMLVYRRVILALFDSDSPRKIRQSDDLLKFLPGKIEPSHWGS